MTDEICPFADICLIYKNFRKAQKSDRIDIIQESEGGYSCIPLDSLNDFDISGTTIEEGLKGRIRETESGGTNSLCSYISFLNKK